MNPDPTIDQFEQSQVVAVHRRVVRVQHYEIDAMGCVAISQIVRWMEETEYEFLRSRDLSVSMNDERGLYGFPRLTTKVEVLNWPDDGDEIAIDLKLLTATPKQLSYAFEINRHHPPQFTRTIARGSYAVACCRFPQDQAPYAILIPDWVMGSLVGRPTLETS